MKKEYYELRVSMDGVYDGESFSEKHNDTKSGWNWCTIASDNGVNRNGDEKWWKMERTYQKQN